MSSSSFSASFTIPRRYTVHTPLGLSRIERREQQFFEKRTQGFHDDFKGYRKSDALLGMTYYNGLSDESEVVMRRLNYRAANVLVLKLGNC